MKDNITCEVINDMLPLYVSGVLSDDSKILVTMNKKEFSLTFPTVVAIEFLAFYK